MRFFYHNFALVLQQNYAILKLPFCIPGIFTFPHLIKKAKPMKKKVYILEIFGKICYNKQ